MLTWFRILLRVERYVHSQRDVIKTTHVAVADNACKIQLVVSTADGEELDGDIHSLDPLSDLAVVKVRRKVNGKWPTVKFGEFSHHCCHAEFLEFNQSCNIVSYK